MMLGRKRFVDAISRQLDVFAADEVALLREIAELKRRYEKAGRADAEEAYGGYADAVDTAAETLVAMRDRFAGTLADENVDAYVHAFDVAVTRRWPSIALAMENL